MKRRRREIIQANRDARGRLRSTQRGDLITQTSTTKFSDRAVAISGLLARNS